ncbi:hypothetical protein [Streptomyces scopuliridis]|uniref:hypothetical protein n=1 Tax=Streptomyces scopuliridis TaxID=452529 RepID=UPI0036C82AF1
MLFAALLIRRPRRLRYLRRLATAQAGPATRTLLPGPAATATVGSRLNTLPPLPAAFRRAAPPIVPSAWHDQEQREKEERAVRVWIHLDQYGRADTAFTGEGAGVRP